MEFARVPWADQMIELAQALRARGTHIPDGATVTLVSVPKHLRDETGRPMFRAVIIDPSAEDDALTEHLNADLGEGVNGNGSR